MDSFTIFQVSTAELVRHLLPCSGAQSDSRHLNLERIWNHEEKKETSGGFLSHRGTPISSSISNDGNFPKTKKKQQPFWIPPWLWKPPSFLDRFHWYRWSLPLSESRNLISAKHHRHQILFFFYGATVWWALGVLLQMILRAEEDMKPQLLHAAGI